MTNLALNKDIEENYYKNYQIVTNGIKTGYTGQEGFCWFKWPGYLTLDLGACQTLKAIRFLLWDGLGSRGGVRNSRKYCYRLLLSEDHKVWNIIYDTLDEGSNGWQIFRFPNGIKTRYLKIHCISNSANEFYHVVEIEAHNDDYPQPEVEYTMEKTIIQESFDKEQGDSFPMEHNIRLLINKFEEIIKNYPIITPEPIQSVISQLKIQVIDIRAIEKNQNSIRREIINPVKAEIEKSTELSKSFGKFSVWSFWVGLIGGILAIFSLILTIYTLIHKY